MTVATGSTADLALAGRALARWGLAGAIPTSINLSENHSFRVDCPDGRRYVLRLHRPGYQTRASIESELAWLAALGRETDVPVPRVVPTGDGERLAVARSGQPAVLFEFEPGNEPGPGDDLRSVFEKLGRYAALTHLHAARWAHPSGFVRPTWSARAILDEDGAWGDWRRAPGVAGRTAEALSALDRKLRERLAAYGTDGGRFGLIHADMRLANLLVDGDRLVLLDFDDCGFGWRLYDLAASLSFIETSPQVTALIDAWIAGYTPLCPLGPEDRSMIGVMILLRRMALLAWIGSHGETNLAAQHRETFAGDTVALAHRLNV